MGRKSRFPAKSRPGKKVGDAGGPTPVRGLGKSKFKQGEFAWTKGALCSPAGAGAHHGALELTSSSPGTRHFLLFCGACPEDEGLIRFAAGTAAVSEASLRVQGTRAGC